MSTCPLQVSGNFFEIPEASMTSCWEVMQDASNLSTPIQYEDTEPTDHGTSCPTSEVELGDELIRSAGSTVRQIAELSVCANCQTDVYTEIYESKV